MGNYRLYDAEDCVRNAVGPADGATVLEFWRWAFGNLNEDTLKGLYAEWLVGRLLGLDLPLGGRNGGANSDLILEGGSRIEVKSAAYWQSWKLYTEEGRALSRDEIEERHWRRLEKPLRFQVRRTRDAVDKSGDEPRLWSDIYVFCAQWEKDPEVWDLLDMEQWRFYCLTRDQVLSLPQTFNEDRLQEHSPALKAGGFRERAWDMIDNVRSATGARQASSVETGDRSHD